MSATPTITMQSVTSSQFAAYGHAPELNLLAIQFHPKKNGVADTYHYQNVDAAMLIEFLAAESQGSFFIQRIKKFPEQFPYTKLDPAAQAPVGHHPVVSMPAAASAIALIHSVPVERDAEGYWSHPGLPDLNEGQEEEYRAWLAAQGLEIKYASLDDEDDTHPSYISYFDESGHDMSGWHPAAPAGDGWFTLSIHDTESGPQWHWARRLAGAGGMA